MRQKAIFPLIVLALFALGLIGQYQLSADNLTSRLSTSAYEILMLFILAGEWTLELEEIPLAIEIVRFLAPLVAVASLVYVVADNTRVALGNYFVRYFRGHTVVLGLGLESFQFLQSCHGDSSFVVVERDEENEFISRARALGFKVLVRSTTDADSFRRVNLKSARNIVVFSESDGENVEVALALRDVLQQPIGGDDRARLHIHLKDVGLAQILEEFPRFSSGGEAVEVSFFSVYDLSARLLLRDYPAEIFADIAAHPRVHLAMYGYGRLAEKIITEAALLFQFRNHSRLQITVFDEAVVEKSAAFFINHPRINTVCDIDFVEAPLATGYSTDVVSFRGLESVTQHIICKDIDDENLEIALRLRRLLLGKVGSNAPIFVRMQQSVGLAQLVHTQKGKPEIPDGIYPFGMLDEVLHVDHVLSRRLDTLARAIHDLYLHENIEAATSAGYLSRSWAQLTQAERKQNLQKADHWPVRLRAIRCTSSDEKSAVPELSAREAELQASMEHNRYLAQKRGDGWEYGEQRSNLAKTNPYLLEWDALPAEQRNLETEDARAQPGYFSHKMGQHVQRNIVIGVTGHRLNKMDIGNGKLRQQIEAALGKIQATHPEAHFTVLSPLAEGADRMVATMAMDRLGAQLHVPLPLPYEIGLYDFTSDQSAEEFQALIGRAEFCLELPMKFGSKDELANSTPARAKQYALAGAYIVQRCDYLIAIWDGQPENGIGGTGQVLRWYREGNIDPEFIFPDLYFEPAMKHEAIIFDPFPG